MIQMMVKGLTMDPITNVPIVILKDVEGKKVLPIWIGVFEANAIALELEKVYPPRPMTHDLIKNILDGINTKIVKVVVNDLKDNTFYAEIHINVQGTDTAIDCRPSDGIAVALRAKVPIFVANGVIEKASNVEVSSDFDESEKWRNWLKNLKPEDFGKYKM